MGCTSSTPNMDGYPRVSENSNTENSITENATNSKHSSDETDISIENSFKQIPTVLPMCDNLENNLQLASQNSLKNVTATPEDIQTETVKISVSQEQLYKADTPVKMANINNDKEIIGNNDNQCDENFSTLREVVEKVIKNHDAFESLNRIAIEEATDKDNISDIKAPETENNKDITNSNHDITDPNKNLETTENKEVNLEPRDKEDMPTEEETSPSQSECSRATRWEALADIAAELPPSLAVDPLTGQIYSLANK